MSTAENQLITRQAGDVIKGEVGAGIHLYQSTIGFRLPTGYITSTSNSGANKFAGVVQEEKDNSLGSDGDLKTEMWNHGVFEFDGSGFTIADEGKIAYGTDNFTVAVTPGTAGVPMGRIKEYISTTRVAVELLSPELLAEPTTLINVSPDGADGNLGSSSSPLLTLAAALALVTATRKKIVLAPGLYASAASLTWPVGVTECSITGISADPEETIIHATAGDEVINIQPDATIGAANVLCIMSNLTISADDGIDGLIIDNTNMTNSKKLLVVMRNVAFSSDDDDTERSIKWIHGNNDALIKMYMHGRGLGGNNIEAPVEINPGNAGDRCKCNGMNFEAGIIFGTDAVTSEHEFYACIMKNAGGSGGNDVQVLRTIGCVSRDGTTHAVIALDDFADNAEEVFLNFT
jgi:hypothetical protein